MSGTKHFLVILFLVALAGASQPLSAQRGLGGGGLGLNGLGPRMGENIALAMDLQGELGLSGDQIQALQDLGEEIDANLGPMEDEIDGLRDRVMAGDVAWAEGVLLLQQSIEEYQIAAEPYRITMTEILTSQQHLFLQSAMFDTRLPYGRGLGRGAGVGYAAGVGPGLGVGYAAGVRGGYGMARGGAYGAAYGYGLGAARGLGAGRGLARAGRGYGRYVPRGRGYRWR